MQGGSIATYILVYGNLDLNSDVELFCRSHLISNTQMNSNDNIMYINSRFYRFDIFMYICCFVQFLAQSKWPINMLSVIIIILAVIIVACLRPCSYFNITWTHIKIEWYGGRRQQSFRADYDLLYKPHQNIWTLFCGIWQVLR